MNRFLGSLLSLLIAFALSSPVQAAPNGATVSITGPSLNVYAGPIEFLATVRDSSGVVVPNELVTWSFTGPVQISSATSVTNAAGIARIVVNPTNSFGSATVVVTASIRTNTTVTTSTSRVGQFFAPVGSNFTLYIDAPSSAGAGKSLLVTATLRTTSGVPVPGMTVNWRNSGVGFLLGSSGVTDSAGRVTTSLLFGSADLGSTNLTATAVFPTFEVSGVVSINVGSSSNVKVTISQTKDRIRVEIVGARYSIALIEIDDEFHLIDVTSARQIETFPAKATQHFVSVSVDDVLYASKTLSFQNFESSRNKTITCRALDRVITITGLKPTCPSPFKLSKTPMPANAQVTLCYRPGLTLAMAKPLTKCPPGYTR